MKWSKEFYFYEVVPNGYYFPLIDCSIFRTWLWLSKIKVRIWFWLEHELGDNMKFKFRLPVNGVQEGKEAIEKELEGLDLPVETKLSVKGDNLTVEVSLFGTSKLTFLAKFSPIEEVTTFTLVKDKLAFAHRFYVGKIKASIKTFVEKAGGIVCENT